MPSRLVFLLCVFKDDNNKSPHMGTSLFEDVAGGLYIVNNDFLS